MTARGSYAKGVTKREDILRAALEVFSRQGYRNTSLSELAAAVGLSRAGLLHYFDSKEELYAEVLRIRDEQDTISYNDSDSLPETMVAVMSHNTSVPGLVQLYANLSVAAAESDHPAHDFFVNRYQRMRTVFAEDFKARQITGELDARFDPQRLAEIILAVADGAQVQWLLDPAIDMAADIEYVFSALLGLNTRP